MVNRSEFQEVLRAAYEGAINEASSIAANEQQSVLVQLGSKTFTVVVREVDGFVEVDGMAKTTKVNERIHNAVGTYRVVPTWEECTRIK